MKHSKPARFSLDDVSGMLHDIHTLDDHKHLTCAHLYATLVRDDDIWAYLVIGRRYRYLNDGYVTEQGDTVYPGDPRHPEGRYKQS